MHPLLLLRFLCTAFVYGTLDAATVEDPESPLPKRQLYLGKWDSEEEASRAADKARIVFEGAAAYADLNRPLAEYQEELERLQAMTREEIVSGLRQKALDAASRRRAAGVPHPSRGKARPAQRRAGRDESESDAAEAAGKGRDGVGAGVGGSGGEIERPAAPARKPMHPSSSPSHAQSEHEDSAAVPDPLPLPFPRPRPAGAPLRPGRSDADDPDFHTLSGSPKRKATGGSLPAPSSHIAPCPAPRNHVASASPPSTRDPGEWHAPPRAPATGSLESLPTPLLVHSGALPVPGPAFQSLGFLCPIQPDGPGAAMGPPPTMFAADHVSNAAFAQPPPGAGLYLNPQLQYMQGGVPMQLQLVPMMAPVPNMNVQGPAGGWMQCQAPFGQMGFQFGPQPVQFMGMQQLGGYM